VQTLTRIDAYAISRALVGMDGWRDLRVSPWVGLLLENLGSKAADRALLTQVLGPTVMAQIFGEDPNAAPPCAPDKEEAVYVPPLPETAQLSTPAVQAARNACPFLDKFMQWAKERTPMTPESFLEAGLIFAISTVIAGRCRLHLYKPIYPNLYIMWVAPSSIFKKTTGMEAISDLVEAAASHLLLPQEMSPESFITILGGGTPPNYEKLTPRQRQKIDRGRKYAAQRGMMIDEASSMLGAKRKDYMQGQEELLMRGFDATSQSYSRWTISEGWIEIRGLILSILGATTPSAFTRCVSYDAWDTGQMARYALLYPEKRLPYKQPKLSPEQYRPPADLVRALSTLNAVLPEPRELGALDADEEAPREVIDLSMDEDAREAHAAYTKALSYTLQTDLLDERLHPNYSRLPELTVKVAIDLATINWAMGGARGRRPNISLAEWARAQQIVELWRVSAHRLLRATDIGDDARNETRVLDHLIRYPEGRTLREITKSMGISRKAIQDALSSLIASGDAQQQQRKGTRGPEATIYVAV
jgi:hypothetical protein